MSCKRDEFIESGDAKIRLSTDSILFDTVFTSVGSTTKRFKIFNPHDQPIRISEIRIAGGNASNFRMNIDGISGKKINNIELKAKDSLYAFIEVTVDPNNSNNLLVIRDSIVFITNGNMQRVVLEAWGQDAYFHKNVYLPCNQIWSNDKPHVIYGIAVIQPGCTLTINQGTQVHLHKNSVLAADSGSTLIVNGANGNEVVFQGDRLEGYYAEAAGQWGYIWLSALSKGHSIDRAIIKNGIIGIVCDTFANGIAPTLTIKNTIIKNMSAFGIWGRGTKIQAFNSIFSNCGQHVLAATYGGAYSFYHCTFANYWSGSNRVFETVLLNNYFEDNKGVVHTRPLDSAYFYNCIVYGNNKEEIKFDQSTNTSISFNPMMYNCLIKTETAATSPYFSACVLNKDPDFINTGNNDYRLGVYSEAFNIGNVNYTNRFLPLLMFDYRNLFRLQDGPPDAGAYEYYPQ